jgi:tRNA1Val (adenine37-N6)-methyltransferase
MDSVTQDTFFNGRLRLKQHRGGYRYSIDAVILASAVQPKPGETLVDLGTGCGIIPLILAFRHPNLGRRAPGSVGRCRGGQHP